MSLQEDLEKYNLLEISLKALQTMLVRDLGLKRIIVVMNDEGKQEVYRQMVERSQQQPDKRISYPFAFLKVQELALDRDHMPVKNIRRHGLRIGTDGSTFSTSMKAYVFPMHLSVELTIDDDDPNRVFILSQALTMLGAASAANFNIRLGADFIYNSKIEFPESYTIAPGEVNNPAIPGAMEIVSTFILNTHGGFLRDVAAVNGPSPAITFNIESRGAHGESVTIQEVYQK